MLAIGKNLTPEQRLSKNIVDVLSHKRYAPLAGVLMIGEKAIDEAKTRGTACTNGRDEWYSATMMNALSDAEFRYVLIHEQKHKMYRHLVTWRNLFEIDAEIAGKACDYVINLEINDENPDGFAVMPKGIYEGLVDERFRGMSAAQVFNILRQEKEEQGEGEGEGEGEGQSQGQGQGQGDGEADGDGSGTPNGFDEHDWEGAADLSDADKQQLERDIDEAIRQGALSAGKTGGGESIDVSELLKPQVDWKQILREFVKSTCAGSDFSTYARPNRRYMSSGIIMPSGISQAAGELIFAIDMSGSTGIGKVRPMFITECQKAVNDVKPETLRVLYWDSQVRAEEVYKQDTQADFHRNTKPVGNGGTVVECVSEYIKDKGYNPQAVVILSDGDLAYGWGEFKAPVLWCIVDSPRLYAPYGKTLHIDSASCIGNFS